MHALPVSLKPRLLSNTLRGHIGRKGEGDHLVEAEVLGPGGGGCGGLGGKAVALKTGFDAPGQLDFDAAFD